MVELNFSALESFKQHLEYRADKTLRNLQPFFEAKMFRLNGRTEPSEIILHAYPGAKPESAQILKRTRKEFEDVIIDFFYHLESTKRDDQFKMAYALLEKLETCIRLEDSEIWEYKPDHNRFDELYNFISCGFTFVLSDNNNSSLVIHGGDCD